MRVNLASLSMQNFKGFNDYILKLDGHDANIFGANATGKTTLFDAYSWVLFGIDSNYTSNFSPKPYNADGRETHNIETVVSAEVITDSGKLVKLTRTMAEDWVKQRGETDRTFKGNVYSYYINDVPTSKSDYDTYVKSIVQQDVFRMITNPTAFNGLDWKKRRQMLLDISGADVDGILLKQDKYAALANAMCEREINLDDLRTATDAQRKRTNKLLEQIPVQIAEVRRMDNGVDDAELSTATSRRAALMTEINEIEAQMGDASGIVQRQENEINAIGRLKAQRSDLERDITNSARQKHVDAQITAVQLKAAVQAATDGLNRYTTELSNCERDHAALVATTDALRARWGEVNKQEFVPSGGTDICPHCKQPMPEELRESALEMEKARWQEIKTASLAQISADGKSARLKTDNIAKVMDQLKTNIAAQQRQIEEMQPKLDDAIKAMAQPIAEPDYSANVQHMAFTLQIEERERMLAKAQDGSVHALLASEKRAKMDELNGCDMVIARQEQHKRNLERIRELSENQRGYGEQLADLEKLIILIEQFVTDRCRALEESINALFETVQWKLFDTQINTGIKDTCICLIPGDGPDSPMVPYPDANNAARVNAGLEIIDVLSRYYDVSVPVMIDNAESVNRLRRIDAQRIALFVSEDMPMRVEMIKKMEVA